MAFTCSTVAVACLANSFPKSIGAAELNLLASSSINFREGFSFSISFFASPELSAGAHSPLNTGQSEWLKPPFLASIPLPQRSLTEPLGEPLRPAKTAEDAINIHPPLWCPWAEPLSRPHRAWGSGPDHSRELQFSRLAFCDPHWTSFPRRLLPKTSLLSRLVEPTIQSYRPPRHLNPSAWNLNLWTMDPSVSLPPSPGVPSSASSSPELADLCPSGLVDLLSFIISVANSYTCRIYNTRCQSKKKSRSVNELGLFIGYVHTHVICCMRMRIIIFLYSNLLSVIENWLLHVHMETEPSKV